MWFWKVISAKIDFALTYLLSEWIIKDHVVLDKKNYCKRCDFWKVNPRRIDLAPTYLQSEWRIKDHVVLDKKIIKDGRVSKLELFLRGFVSYKN